MSSEKTILNDVSDTALWVAHYRALESKNKNPLFNDPFAQILVGQRGEEIAKSMKDLSVYAQWSVVIRTVIIDNYIKNLVQDGIDTVINLGAGMDTRPYRLDLPKSLQWIEVDYPNIIQHKEKLLAKETPQVQLQRISLDLADRKMRQELFVRLGSQSKKALVLTEGVIPYLTEVQVATLAKDLHSEKSFYFWITEYSSPEVYKYFQMPQRMKQMRNAPFQFFPADWFAFFKEHGWQPREIRYLGVESINLTRSRPAPWWAYFIIPFLSKKLKERYQKQMGYVLFTKT